MNTRNNNFIEWWYSKEDVGLLVPCSEIGEKFEYYTFSIDREKGKLKIDDNCNGLEAVKKALDRILDENPEEIRRLFHSIIDHVDLTDQHKGENNV